MRRSVLTSGHNPHLCSLDLIAAGNGRSDPFLNLFPSRRSYNRVALIEAEVECSLCGEVIRSASRCSLGYKSTMDTIDRSESNLPSPFPIAPSPLPALAPVFSGDLVATSSPQINPRTLLRGLKRQWWKILLVWVVLAGPVIYLIHRFVKPTFEAFSTLQSRAGSARRHLQTRIVRGPEYDPTPQDHGPLDHEPPRTE